MFRVVQDQLKVSDGWVRCGRCQAVFNAQERLFDLEHDTPPPWQAPPEIPEIRAGGCVSATGSCLLSEHTPPIAVDNCSAVDPITEA